MSKPWQVLRSECRALQSLRRAQGKSREYDETILPHACAATQAPASSLSNLMLPSSAAGLDSPHQAKLRVLARALRRALGASQADSRQRQTRQQREHRLQAPPAALHQGWSLAELLFVCLSPADAPRLRIYWIVA